MGLGTINTILNTAPLIIQGATRLVKLIRERNQVQPESPPKSASLDELKDELDRLHRRLNDNNQADIEQIKLIEELAKQNEALASSLKKSIKWINLITVLAGTAFLTSLVCLIILLKP